MKRLFQIATSGALAAMLAAAEGLEEPSRYYFDHGAEQFTRDNLEKARAWVDEGLQLYPEDVKLILLKQLIEQPPQQQPTQEPSQSQPQSSHEQQQQQQQPENQSDEQDQASAEEQQHADQGESSAPTRMTEEEAMRVLDALKDREAAERARSAADRLRREMSRLPPVEKDW